jgi:PAS domain S-box-containing protein
MINNAGQLIRGRIKELRENTDYVSTLFENLTGYSIIAADFDGNVIAYNEGGRSIFGYDPEEIIGKRNIEIFFPEDFIEDGKLQQIINDLMREEKVSFEGEKVRKNSEIFPALITFILTRDKSGNLVGFIEIVEDLTEQKEAEKAKQLQLTELETALKYPKVMSGWEDGAITAQMSGVGPLQEREPDVFSNLQAEYGSLLDEYLEAIGFDRSPPRRKINDVADRIGDLGCGPRAVVDIHRHAVTAKSSNVNPKRARAYILEGRLLALEVMGYLVDYYRMRRIIYKK